MGTSGLGALLVEDGLLTEADRRTIKRTCGGHGSAFARSILALGLLSEDELAAFIADKTKWKVAPKGLHRQSQAEVWGIIDRPLIERLEVLPLAVEGRTLTVAMLDPLDQDTLKQLAFFTGYRIAPVIATLTEIRTGLKKLLSGYQPARSQLEDFLDNHAGSASRRVRLGLLGGKKPRRPAPVHTDFGSAETVDAVTTSAPDKGGAKAFPPEARPGSEPRPAAMAAPAAAAKAAAVAATANDLGHTEDFGAGDDLLAEDESASSPPAAQDQLGADDDLDFGSADDLFASPAPATKPAAGGLDTSAAAAEELGDLDEFAPPRAATSDDDLADLGGLDDDLSGLSDAEPSPKAGAAGKAAAPAFDFGSSDADLAAFDPDAEPGPFSSDSLAAMDESLESGGLAADQLLDEPGDLAEPPAQAAQDELPPLDTGLSEQEFGELDDLASGLAGDTLTGLEELEAMSASVPPAGNAADVAMDFNELEDLEKTLVAEKASTVTSGGLEGLDDLLAEAGSPAVSPADLGLEGGLDSQAGLDGLEALEGLDGVDGLDGLDDLSASPRAAVSADEAAATTASGLGDFSDLEGLDDVATDSAAAAPTGLDDFADLDDLDNHGAAQPLVSRAADLADALEDMEDLDGPPADVQEDPVFPPSRSPVNAATAAATEDHDPYLQEDGKAGGPQDSATAGATGGEEADDFAAEPTSPSAITSAASDLDEFGALAGLDGLEDLSAPVAPSSSSAFAADAPATTDVPDDLDGFDGFDTPTTSPTESKNSAVAALAAEGFGDFASDEADLESLDDLPAAAAAPNNSPASPQQTSPSALDPDPARANDPLAVARTDQEARDAAKRSNQKNRDLIGKLARRAPK